MSDGAGSAARAYDGARIVSGAICEALAQPLRDIDPLISDETFCQWAGRLVEKGVQNARTVCEKEARLGESLAAFHATVVGVVVVDGLGIFFQIGDGGACALRVNSESIVPVAFSHPENGEYVNETYFFTEARWRKHLRLSKFGGRADAVWLMTDGAFELVVPRGTRGVRETTFQEIERLIFYDSSRVQEDVLADILSSKQASSRNEDDKTLLIIRIQP